MAREKSQDKKKAILDAAITVFAERGFYNTPTALISKTAGVADGTLFTYFATKDELISEVYLALKREVGDYLLEGADGHQTFKDRMHHIWDRFIDWGLHNPQKFKTLRHIGESYELAPRVQAESLAPFSDLPILAQQSVASGELRDYPIGYIASMIDMQASMTIRYIAQNSGEAADYRQIGFDVLWNGITR